ncbi:MAG: DMT family transporter [Acidiferrobacterales bacterium]
MNRLSMNRSQSAYPPINTINPGPPRRAFAMGLMVVSSIVISFGGLIIRNIEDADSWQINLYRSVALVTAVTLILLYQYRGMAITYVRGIGRSGVVGGVMLAMAGITFLQSLTHTTVANTLFILSAIPFFAAGLARVFLKERLQRATLVAMVVAATGIVIMLSEGFGIGSAYGNAMALITAFCFASFAVIVRRNRQTDMLPTVLVSGVCIALVTFLARIGDLGVSLHDLLLSFLWGGLLSGLANWMFVIAARHLAAAEVTLFMLLEFALGPLWVWLFVGEVPSRWTLLGGALVISSVAVRTLLELRRSKLTRAARSIPEKG